MDISTLSRTVNADINLLYATADDAGQGKVAAEAKKSAVAPLLMGSNVLVSYGITDIEALVSQLKNENADTRLSMKLKSLSSIADGLSSQHLKSLEKALALADSVKQLENAQNGLAQDTSSAKASLEVLQMETEALEKQIENARANEEDYNKNLQKLKERKAEIAKKISDAEAAGEEADQSAIAALKAQLSDVETKIKTNEDALAATQAKIKADTASLEGKKAEITALKDKIAANTAQIEKNKNEISALGAQISAIVASIDENTLKTIADELLVDEVEEAESPRDVKKQEEKLEATDVVRLISDALDAIAKDIAEEIAEKRVENV